jgi:hypothetical protein
VPAVALASGAYLLIAIAELDYPKSGASWSATMLDFLGVVVFAPLVETWILSLMLRGLLKISDNHVMLAAVSALVWGILHAMQSPIRLIPSSWSFFIFSCAFLGWRKHSYQKAFVAAVIPHSLLNLSLFLVVLALEKAA